MKAYVASSWRNERQPAVVEALRTAGHEVYDFRNPAPGNEGFSWKQCLLPRAPSNWTVDDYKQALVSPRAQEGFTLDMDALRSCDACVLVLPCGRSAHLELGWAAGSGKRCLVLCESLDEPELMYLMCGTADDVICESVEAVVAKLETADPRKVLGPYSEGCLDCGVLTRDNRVAPLVHKAGCLSAPKAVH